MHEMTDEEIDAVTGTLPGDIKNVFPHWVWRQFARSLFQKQKEKKENNLPALCPGPEPISAEAQRVGMQFCCGREERLVNEVAALRNVVQRALIDGAHQNIVEAWNYYFPDHPLT